MRPSVLLPSADAMVHGSRVNLPEAMKQFECVCCRSVFPAKSPLVMFRAARWKRKIDAGEPLHASEIDGLSKVAAAEYLRAMGVTVARDAVLPVLQEQLKAKLGSDSSWSKCQRT